jgi:hypothetical protein
VLEAMAALAERGEPSIESPEATAVPGKA